MNLDTADFIQRTIYLTGNWDDAVSDDGQEAKDVAARSIRDIRKVWSAALKRPGIEGEYTFHDTKASFVTTVGRHASGPTTQNWAIRISRRRGVTLWSPISPSAMPRRSW